MTQHQDDLQLEAYEPTQQRITPNFLQVIWHRKTLVLLGVVVGLAMAGLFYAQRSPVYQATAQVLVVKKRPDALPIVTGDPRQAYVDDYLSTHLVLIRSPEIVERAIQKGELKKLTSFSGMSDPTSEIIANLAVSRDTSQVPGSRSNIINLAYRGSVPHDCSQVLAAIIESYKDFLDEIYLGASSSTIELIDKAKGQLNKQLVTVHEEYREFRKRSPLVLRSKDGMSLNHERVNAIESKRSSLLIRHAELLNRIETAEKARQDGNAKEALQMLVKSQAEKMEQTLLPPAERNLEDQIFALQLKEQQLLEDYASQHPQVRATRQQLTMLKEALTQATNARDRGLRATSASHNLPPDQQLQLYLTSMRQELNDIESVRRTLTILLEKEEQEARDLNGWELQDQGHRAQITRLQTLYDSTVKRLDEMNLIKDVGGYDARMISRPAPGFKIAPSLYQMLVGGFMLGVMGGMGLAYLAEISDKSFRTPEEIRRRLGLPLIGHIPHFTPSKDILQKIADGEPTLDPRLCTYHRPKSVEAEAYRGVRTALYFSTRGEGHKVIQITSPDMGDGKSTLSANLAVSIAQSGKSVVLIDADFRRPRLHKVFGVSADSGLAPVILGQSSPDGAVKPTVIPGLSILPCGPLPPNPAELLTSARLKEVLDELRQKYDFVLVDTPPILAVTDPCVVAPRVDGVLLTIRVSKNSRPHAERAREILGTLGATVLGVVVNGFGGQERSGYGYNYGYGYGYGYGTRYGYNYGYKSGYGEEGYYTEDAPTHEPRKQALGNGSATANGNHAHGGPKGERVTQTAGSSRGRAGLLGRFFTWWV